MSNNDEMAKELLDAVMRGVVKHIGNGYGITIKYSKPGSQYSGTSLTIDISEYVDQLNTAKIFEQVKGNIEEAIASQIVRRMTADIKDMVNVFMSNEKNREIIKEKIYPQLKDMIKSNAA